MITCALAGNPNVGKSTVFNAFTGLRQHTGNWSGKTVGLAEGRFEWNGEVVRLVDLPGTYSLTAHSPEEEAARDFITDGRPDVVVCVCDASSLERNLILAQQTAERARRLVLCVNLIDEAKKKGVTVDADRLSEALGCPVVLTAARGGIGLDELKTAIVEAARAPERETAAVCASCGGCDGCAAERFSHHAAEIAAASVRMAADPTRRDRAVDRLLCGRFTGIPLLLGLMTALLWLTVKGSGYLSGWLDAFFGWLLPIVRAFFARFLPAVAVGALCDGVLSTVAAVIAVMLPTMAVFFPLFTLLEDIGLLPRAAFNLDRCFKGCGSCGKQSLTMMMSVGCTAAGVTGCRIIDSPRERLIAVLTAGFMPCSGRLPLLVAGLGLLGLPGGWTALGLVALFLAAIGMTLGVSKLLSVTVLRGQTAGFTLELPPYRVPKIGETLVRAFLERTGFVLGRAVTVAAPFGLVIWLTRQITVGGESLWSVLTAALDPVGRIAGMDGVLLLSFLFAFPAAELMLPLALAGSAESGLAAAFAANGWGGVTVVCVVTFALFHFPCAAALMTVKKETGQMRWVWLAALLPTGIGYALCCLIRLGAALLGLG